ncbi:MAG: multicopper oxidase domain-containing protein [Hyphomicrobium sp.]
MRRRDLLKFTSYGALVAAVTTSPQWAFADGLCGPCTGAGVEVADVEIHLAIMRQRVEMVDGKQIFMLGYKDLGGGLCTAFPGDPNSTCTGARIPGPVLRVKQGQRVKITIDNLRAERHGFAITGYPAATTEIAPNGCCSVSFVADQTGTFLYHDNLGGSPLYRLLGLHGAFIVQPDYAAMLPGALITPYAASQMTPATRLIFEALGDVTKVNGRFPGGKWVPCAIDQPYSTQEKIWLETQVDPRLNALLNGSESAPIASSPSLTSNIWDTFTPRYFTINGRSGFDLSEHEDVVCKNFIGEPTLIRCINAGLAHHANHIHGNHVFELAEADPIRDALGRGFDSGNVAMLSSVPERDVWPMWPMQRCDMLLPYEVPPDIPFDIKIGGVAQPSQFEAMVARNVNIETAPAPLVSTFEPFPLRYVMHCHCEMSTTAAGGNYPQGLVTHWEILGGLGGRAQLANAGGGTSGG